MKKRSLKKFAAGVLIASIFINGLSVVSVKAEESEADVSPILELVDENTISENYDTLDRVALMYTSEENLTSLNLDEVKEVMDNGTDIVVSGTSIENVETAFETEMILEEDAGYNNVGAYVSADGDSYKLTPIYTGLVYEEEEEVTEEQHELSVEELGEVTTIDMEDVYEQVKGEANTEELLNQLSDEDLASLQATTTIGDSFSDNSKFVYFYKKGTASAQEQIISIH